MYNEDLTLYNLQWLICHKLNQHAQQILPNKAQHRRMEIRQNVRKGTSHYIQLRIGHTKLTHFFLIT